LNRGFTHQQISLQPKGARFVIDFPGIQPGILSADLLVDPSLELELEEVELPLSNMALPNPNSQEWEKDAGLFC
jgi:hypothetical protein